MSIAVSLRSASGADMATVVDSVNALYHVIPALPKGEFPFLTTVDPYEITEFKSHEMAEREDDSTGWSDSNSFLKTGNS
jgi:hypothetical protein